MKCLTIIYIIEYRGGINNVLYRLKQKEIQKHLGDAIYCDATLYTFLQ